MMLPRWPASTAEAGSICTPVCTAAVVGEYVGPSRRGGKAGALSSGSPPGPWGFCDWLASSEVTLVVGWLCVGGLRWYCWDQTVRRTPTAGSSRKVAASWASKVSSRVKPSCPVCRSRRRIWAEALGPLPRTRRSDWVHRP